MPSVIMLSVIYVLPSVAIKSIMPSFYMLIVVMLNVVNFNVVAPHLRWRKCRRKNAKRKTQNAKRKTQNAKRKNANRKNAKMLKRTDKDILLAFHTRAA
jgi:hypothetical protein